MIVAAVLRHNLSMFASEVLPGQRGGGGGDTNRHSHMGRWGDHRPAERFRTDFCEPLGQVRQASAAFGTSVIGLH